MSELERKKATIDELNSFIYGALGEQKVVKTLETLPDEYFLINDFAVSFSPAIYNRQENDYIKFVQIDHILVAPSGVFLIETKNWSEKSLGDLSLRSPVQQIKRTSFVLSTQEGTVTFMLSYYFVWCNGNVNSFLRAALIAANGQ